MQQFWIIFSADDDEEPLDFNVRSLSLNDLDSEQYVSERDKEEKGNNDTEQNNTGCGADEGKLFHCWSVSHLSSIIF